MSSRIDRPRLEGSVAVLNARRLSFAEYGVPRGNAVIWMHGTPGARRQIPFEARAYAHENDIRIIGIDRPGIGSSTPHLYDNVYEWTADLERLMEVLAIDKAHIIGLSGGGPYALAAGAAFPDRIHGVGVIGEWRPRSGLMRSVVALSSWRPTPHLSCRLLGCRWGWCWPKRSG